MKNFIGKTLLGLLLLFVGGTAFLLIRQAQAFAQIERDLETMPEPLLNLGSTSSLEILPLYEKAGDEEEFIIGHGVSYLIRTDGAEFLLDVGNNPEKTAEAPFLHNMRALGVDWAAVKFIVISHPHPDHIGGVDAWTKGRVMLGSQPVALDAKLVHVPVNLKGKDLVMALDPQPFILSPGVATVGIVPFKETFPFSLFQPRGSEQSLVINVDGHGLVLITACGHPTLEQLVIRAEATFGCQ
jgi:7,8-dihydropterin-6-yl-methyl-4-(beta-D-ribofuranosyl)aminobenzene 5'-phosphate synthase